MKQGFKQAAAAALIGLLMCSTAGAAKAEGYCVREAGSSHVAAAESEGPFYDVSRDAWYCSAIEYCKSHLLLTGDPDGNFRPNDPVSRAEAATVLKRLATDETFYFETYFSDVADGAWYAQDASSYKRLATDETFYFETYFSDVADGAWYAQDASSYGNLLGGNSRQDNASSPLGYTAYFYPNANVEREDFAVGIFNVFNLSDYGWKTHFPDIDQISWTDSYGYNYRQAACAMSNLGIMVGDGQGYFNPKQALTRAELAQVLYNIDTNDSELLP